MFLTKLALSMVFASGLSLPAATPGLPEYESVAPVNLGLASDFAGVFFPSPDPLLAFGGRHLAFHVVEADQEVDLNMDGDLSDRIVHLYDLRTGRIRNLRKEATSSMEFFDGNLIYTVSEGDESIDLNGDGDTSDFVLHASDVISGQTVSLMLATLGPFTERVHGVSGEALFFSVSELGQGGLDRNGDGDAADVVLHRFGPQKARSIGLRGMRRPVLQANEVFARTSGSNTITVNSNGAVFLLPEDFDLNGDGDRRDSVLAAFDPVRGKVVASGFSGRPSFSLSGTRTAFRVSEKSQGNTDLNNDGDLDDEVAHMFDAASGVAINYGIAAISSAWAGDWVATIVHEDSQGGQDLNGDGDVLDQIAFVGRFDDPSPLNTGYAVLSVGGTGDRVFLTVNEVAQGFKDLNGDGDVEDLILFSMDPATGTCTNLRLAMGGLPGSGERLIPLLVDEQFGSQDFNLDGDQADIVMGLYDGLTDTFVNTGIAVSPAGLGTSGLRVEVQGSRLAFPAHEAAGGQDYNSDGDTSDVVPQVYDADTGLLLNSATAGDFRLGTSIIALLVDEEMQGIQDLNEDGDMTDGVLHYLPID